MTKIGQYLQPYAGGYIARDGDKYQYVENEKVVKSYASTDELVADQSKAAENDSSSFRDTLKSKPAKATKKKAAKK